MRRPRGSAQAPSDKATTLRIVLEKLVINMSQDQEPRRRKPSNQYEEAGRTTPLDHDRGGGGGMDLNQVSKSRTKRIQVSMIKM